MGPDSKKNKSEVVVEFGTNNAPNSPASKSSTSSFIAKPGAPNARRIITTSRMKQMYGHTGRNPTFTTVAKRETMSGDTLSVFIRAYQHFVMEQNVFNDFNEEQINAAINKLKSPNLPFSLGLLNNLDEIAPGIVNALYSVMLPQYGRGEFGITDNILSIHDTAGILQRLNSFGTGDHLRSEMIAALENATFCRGTELTTDKDKGFKITQNGATLIEGKVNSDTHTLSLNIDANVPPEQRDLAIKHMMALVASHTQQNNSNVFTPKFGDNPWENLRVLQLAIGQYNLRIPEGVVENYIHSQLPAQMASLSDSEKDTLNGELIFWAQHAQTFSEKLTYKGTNIIDDKHRPRNSSGFPRSLAATQKMLRDRVTENVLPAPTNTPRPTSPE